MHLMPTCIVIHLDTLDGSVDAHSSTHTYSTSLYWESLLKPA